MIISDQTGQVLPGTILSLSMVGGLGVTATPALTDFVEEAERVSLKYAHSALETSLNVNHMLAGLKQSGKLIIDGQTVKLKHGYPVADIAELEKVASFGTQILERNSSNSIKVWSLYKSWCFVYTEAAKNGSVTTSAQIGEINAASEGKCKS